MRSSKHPLLLVLGQKQGFSILEVVGSNPPWRVGLEIQKLSNLASQQWLTPQGSFWPSFIKIDPKLPLSLKKVPYWPTLLFTWGDGGVMVSMLVSHINSPRFYSQWLQMLLTSFLRCAKFCPKQISPACTKKLYQHSYCAKFCSKWIGIMIINLSSVPDQAG